MEEEIKETRVEEGGKETMEEEIKETRVEEGGKENMTEDIEKTTLEVIKLVGASCIEGGKPEIVLKVNDLFVNKWKEVSIYRDALTPKMIKSLIVSNNGICPDENAICKRLEEEFVNRLLKGTLDVKYYHNFLGWKKVKDKGVFYGKEAISYNNEVSSSYYGELDVSQVGLVENITNLIEKFIVNQEEWSPLEAVLSFGVGATVLAYANTYWNASLNNLIVHILGGSSTGKSTSLQLFTALGSNPEPKKGFWINYNSSDVSIVKRIGNNYGYPVAIDELSGGSKKEYSDFVYTIGNGEEKDRLKAGGMSFQKSATFQTVTMSSGEVSLYKKCAKNEGIRARCVEIPNINWTSSKEQSNAIKECTKENHGLVTPLIAQALVDNDTKWRERWGDWKKYVDDKMKKDEVKLAVSERIADFVALFTLSAEILNDVLGISLNLEEIFKFCYMHIIIANEDEGNLGDREDTVIKDYISMNKEKFADGTFYGGCRSQYNVVTLSMSDDGFIRNANRKIINGEEYDTVYVFRNGVIDKVLSDAGFSDIKVSLHKLNEGGYLLAKDKKRNTTEHIVNGTKQDCVCVYYKDESYEMHKAFEEE